MPQGATIESMQWRRTVLFAGCASAAAFVASCATPPAPSTPRLGPNTGCVTQSQATHIWVTVNHRLATLELDPHHAGVSAVTTGDALVQITTYMDQQLLARGLTEHEVDRLDHLSVVQAGCNGSSLIVNVTMTLVQDDYLKASGAVDHRDASVGRAFNLLQEYLYSGGSWKESDLTDLTPPGASTTPQLLRLSHTACYTLLRSI
jgi:hypothetical protein